MSSKNIHILAVAGTITAPLAVELQRLGHRVTGSDQQKIYPPISTILHKAHIPINQTPISKNIDLAILGSSLLFFTNTKNEYDQIIQKKIPHITATNYLTKYVAKKESIIVAGAFGKTTITALVSLILKKAGYNPSYMFGGKSVNRISSLSISTSDWSVLEGDESINGLDTKAKFLYYPIKYLVLTSADYEHKEIYKTEADNLNAYKNLVKNIPKDGVLIYNPHNKNILKLLPYCQAKTIPYNFKLNFSTPLIGQHNHENICAAYTLCQYLGIKDQVIQSSIKSFRGIARRLELLGNYNNILFFDDFAQSPDRIQQSLIAINNQYPKRPVKLFFEAHASFLQYKNSLKSLNQAFALAQEIVIGPLKYSAILDQKDRVSAADYKNIIGDKVKYIPVFNQIYDHYTSTLKPNDIFVHMSSGGLDGLKCLNKIIKHTKTAIY